MTVEYKYKGHKSRYQYDANFGQVKSIYDKKRGAMASISIDIQDDPAPETINFNQNNLNMRFEKIK